MRINSNKERVFESLISRERENRSRTRPISTGKITIYDKDTRRDNQLLLIKQTKESNELPIKPSLKQLFADHKTLL